MKRRKVSTVKQYHPNALNGKAIGRRIAEARARREWTRRDLARAAGVSEGGLAAWECGVRIPQTDALNKLTVALRRKAEWLLWGQRSLWNRKASENGI